MMMKLCKTTNASLSIINSSDLFTVNALSYPHAHSCVLNSFALTSVCTLKIIDDHLDDCDGK